MDFPFNEMKPNQGKCHLIVADINHNNFDSKSFVYLEDAFLEKKDVVKLQMQNWLLKTL